jgi:hypothetical protein
MSRRKYTLQDLCREVGKNHVYVGQIQAGLDLIKPEPPMYYSRGYINFIRKCTALRTFGVQIGDIQDLFRKELKVLRLLNLHTLSKSPTWFLDGCSMESRDPNRLLLTGYDLGFDLLSGPVQAGLDFGSEEEELFESHQMGESLDHVVDLYRKQLSKVKRRVEEERPIIRMAINWSTKAFDF